jgi:hypothetical protein
VGGLFCFFDQSRHERSRSLVQAAQRRLCAAPTPAELENAKARFLGKSAA